mgnify:CR=1 FL=1
MIVNIEERRTRLNRGNAIFIRKFYDMISMLPFILRTFVTFYIEDLYAFEIVKSSNFIPHPNRRVFHQFAFNI